MNCRDHGSGLDTSVRRGFGSDNSLLAEAVRSAATEIDKLPDVDVVNWENFRIGGHCALGHDRERNPFGLGLDPRSNASHENVLFEFGLAIGADIYAYVEQWLAKLEGDPEE